MGSKRVGAVRFQAISGDHRGSAVPHVHAFVGSGEAIVELLANGDARLSLAHGAPIRGTITAHEERTILRAARDHHEALMLLWKVSQGE